MEFFVNCGTSKQNSLAQTPDFLSRCPPLTEWLGGSIVGLTTNGGFSLYGVLGDGTRFQQSASVSVSGDVPLFVSINSQSGLGLIAGWINLSANTPVTSLVWIRKSNEYRSGFTQRVSRRHWQPSCPANWTQNRAGNSLILKAPSGALRKIAAATSSKINPQSHQNAVRETPTARSVAPWSHIITRHAPRNIARQQALKKARRAVSDVSGNSTAQKIDVERNMTVFIADNLPENRAQS